MHTHGHGRPGGYRWGQGSTLRPSVTSPGWAEPRPPATVRVGEQLGSEHDPCPPHLLANRGQLRPGATGGPGPSHPRGGGGGLDSYTARGRSLSGLLDTCEVMGLWQGSHRPWREVQWPAELAPTQVPHKAECHLGEPQCVGGHCLHLPSIKLLSKFKNLKKRS